MQHQRTFLIYFLSSAVLDNFDTTITTADFSSNITFTGDYDALNDDHTLDITRAMIYNYLLSIYLPLESDIVLIKGFSFSRQA